KPIYRRQVDCHRLLLSERLNNAIEFIRPGISARHEIVRTDWSRRGWRPVRLEAVTGLYVAGRRFAKAGAVIARARTTTGAINGATCRTPATALGGGAWRNGTREDRRAHGRLSDRVVCDNYLIGPNGPGERQHRFPEVITGLG